MANSAVRLAKGEVGPPPAKETQRWKGFDTKFIALGDKVVYIDGEWHGKVIAVGKEFNSLKVRWMDGTESDVPLHCIQKMSAARARSLKA
jgi:ureidoglycolate hydrolase